jgi:hypothetical protein
MTKLQSFSRAVKTGYNDRHFTPRVIA